MGLRLHYTQVRKILRGLIGENGLKVLQACKKGEVTDEQIMKKTGLQLNVIRSILNQLHYQGLIGYNREKTPRLIGILTLGFPRTIKSSS
jgi:transcription initiation factor IIE alpha subunit